MEADEWIESLGVFTPEPPPSNRGSRLIQALWLFFRSLAISSYEAVADLSLFQLALRLLIFVVGLSVIQELCNNNPVLDVVNVPKEFQEHGYTADVVARRIKDRITEIDQAEKSIERQRPFQLAADSPLPDIQLPEANLSLKTAILFVRQLLHFPIDRILVDVTLDLPIADENTSDGETRGSKTPEVQLVVVVRHFPGINVAPTPEPIIAASLEKALSPLAQAVMAETDPYVLGVYVLDEEGRRSSQPYFRKAAELEQRAAELNPDDPNAYGDWGNALYYQGKLPEAIAKVLESH